MRIPIAAFIAAVLPTIAAAETVRGNPPCKEGAMPFEATVANRLTGAPLQQAVSGKRLVFVRESLRKPGLWSKIGRELRTDGSFVYTCEFARSPSGPWQPCQTFGSTTKRVAGARDVGVWNLKNDAVCATMASFGEKSANCFAIHRQGAAVAAKRVSGQACVQGAIELH